MIDSDSNRKINLRKLPLEWSNQLLEVTYYQTTTARRGESSNLNNRVNNIAEIQKW